MRVALHGILIFDERSVAKIRNACVTRVVHEYVWLTKCQYSGAIFFRTATYSFDTPMNHVTGVKVVEAPSDVRQLLTRINMGKAEWDGRLRVQVGPRRGAS